MLVILFGIALILYLSVMLDLGYFTNNYAPNNTQPVKPTCYKI